MIKYKNTIRPTCPYCGFMIAEHDMLDRYDFNEFAGTMLECRICGREYDLYRNQQNHDNYDSRPFQIRGFCGDCKYFCFGDHNLWQLTVLKYLDEDCSENESSWCGLTNLNIEDEDYCSKFKERDTNPGD